MTAAELAILVRLLDERLKDALIQKIHQPAARRLVIHLHTPRVGKSVLLVDLDPASPRLLLTERRLPNPEAAPALCLALRKFIENGRVRAVSQVASDRIVVVDIDRKTEGEIAARRLVIEFLPRRTALFVLDADGRILVAESGVHDKSRDLERGAVWSPPPPPQHQREAPPPFAGLEGWTDADLFARLDAELPEDVEAGIDKKLLDREVERAIQRQFKRLAKVEADCRRAEGGTELFRLGELLKSSLGRIKRGDSEVELRDWEAEGEVWVRLEIDPQLSPADNLEKVFAAARKKERSREVVADRLAEQRTRLADLQALAALLREGDADSLALALEEATRLEIEVPLSRAPQPARSQQVVAPRLPYKTFRSLDGLEIRVGRSNRDNDELTFHHARGNDWWFHAEDYAGSHVVVPFEGELPEQTLLDAATLAVEHSKASSGGKQGVSYTRRKNVTKFRGAKPGQVQLKERRTILIRFDPDRLARLLKRDT